MSRPNHTASWPELTAILLARLSVLWLLVLVSLAIPNDDTAFFALMGIAFAVTIPYSLWLRNRLHTMRFAPLQFAVDFVVTAGLIHFTGGIHSELTLLYPLIILAAGIVIPPQQAVKVTILGILAYILTTTLISRNEPMGYMPGGQQGGLPPFFSAIALRVVIFSLFGATGIYISRRCAYYGRNIRNTRSIIQTLLEKLNAGVLLLNQEGLVLSANPEACDLLRTAPEQLAGRSFAERCTTDMQSLPEHYGSSAWINRPGAPPIPAALRRTEIELPNTAVPGSKENEGTARITLLVLTDLSHPLQMERQLAQANRTAAATRFAGEMAHEIRTPLTTISASIQLLQHYEQSASTTDWLPNSPRKRDRTELFNHILGASEKMDSAVRHFVDFAEYSPADLISIIKLDSIDQNEGYIGHLNTREKGFKHGQNPDSG